MATEPGDAHTAYNNGRPNESALRDYIGIIKSWRTVPDRSEIGVKYCTTTHGGRPTRTTIPADGVCNRTAGDYIRSMPAPNILIVAIDGLRASSLGAYGNTTFPTPALDHFAAESFLCDACYAPTPTLVDVYGAMWHSRHPLRLTNDDERERTLPRLLSQRGYATTLITDDPQLHALPAVDCFDQFLQHEEAATATDEHAHDIVQTALGRLFAAAGNAFPSSGSVTSSAGEPSRPPVPQLIWIHSRGLYGPWDAPLELQQLLLDDGDPLPRQAVAPPDLLLTESDDPDIVFQSGCAYAAQVMVLDTCWNALLETLADEPTDTPWLVSLIGVRGFPLGEHRRIGGVDERLFADQLHVPWLLRFPHSHAAMARTPALTSHLDLLPTLLDWIADADRPKLPGDGESILPLLTTNRATLRNALLSTSSTGARAVRTPTWCLRQDRAAYDDDMAAEALPSAELYVRPDDRWEANDVAKLCPEVVDELAATGDDIAQCLTAGRPLPAPTCPAASTSDTEHYRPLAANR